jgi:hypothetical protein
VLGVRDLGFKPGDLRVEALLLLPRGLAERRGNADGDADGEDEDEQR